MKKTATVCAALLMTASVFAQAPQKMSYQAVIRNSSDALVTSAPVGMRISILQGSSSGTAVYAETQTPSTNANGLVSVEIGSGTPVTGTFADIDWADGPYFIRTQTDPTGGTAYSITGTSQLLSVPYALYSETTGDTSMWKKNETDIYYTNGNVGIGTSTPGELTNSRLEVVGRVSFRSNANDPSKVLHFNDFGTAQRLYTDAVSGAPADLIIGTYPNGHMNQLYLQQSTGHVGIGTSTPRAKLDVNGSVKVSNDAALATANNVGAIRYRTSGNNSYCEMVMQTGASTYAWVIIKQNSW
jgi:hypothetical protein